MKRFSKIALGAIALTVGIGSLGLILNAPQKIDAVASASPYLWTLSAGQLSTVAGNENINNVAWSWTKISYLGFDNTKGAQLGSKSNPAGSVTFTAALNNFGSTITNITVNACTGGAGTVSISANGASVLTSTALTTASADYSAANLSVATSAGDLVITINGTTKATYLKSISVAYVSGDVAATGISLSKTSLTGTAGGSEVLTATVSPENTTHGSVDWSTSNSAVAMVSDTGTISFVTVGTATITATVHDDASLSATCTVTVVDPNAITHRLKLVTDTKQLVIGSEIVILSDETTPVAMSTTQNANNRGKTSVTPSSGSLDLSASSTAAVFTLGVGTTAGTYSFHDTNGYLYAASSSSNYLRSETELDAEGSWNISITNANESTVTTVTAKGSNSRNLLQYNSSSSIFSCYSSSQKNVVLYEQTTHYNAGSWAIGFNTALDATCSNTAPTAVTSSTWSDQSTSYGALGAEEKAILKAISTADANDGTATKQAISRYDYVMGKAAYASFADFIGRFPSRSATPAANTFTSNATTTIIPLIALGVGAGALSLFILAKRKKHE